MFQTVPLLFWQLNTVHGFRGNHSVPIIDVFLPMKSEVTYIRFLQESKMLQPTVSPSAITTDYVMAMINAMRKEFTVVQLRLFFPFNAMHRLENTIMA